MADRFEVLFWLGTLVCLFGLTAPRGVRHEAFWSTLFLLFLGGALACASFR